MELMRPKTKKKKRNVDAIELFYGSTEELEYPKTDEFQDIVDLLQSEKEEEATKKGHRSAEQRAIAVTACGDESEVSVDVFVCKICRKSFETEKTCEKHILRRHSTSPRRTEEQKLGSEMNGYVNHDQDYKPIFLGKWSKDLEHPTQVPDSGITFIDDDQTRPKASPEEQNYARVVKKLDECLQTRSLQRRPPSPGAPRVHLLDGMANDSGIHSPSASPLGRSTNLVDLDIMEESKMACQTGAAKIYVDIKTRRFQCEACGSSFETLEEAETHVTPDDEAPEIPKKLSPDDTSSYHTTSHNTQLLDIAAKQVPDHTTEKCSEGNEHKETDDQVTEPDSFSGNPHSENPDGGTNEEYATLDVKEAGKCNGTKSLSNSETELFKKNGVSFSNDSISKRKKSLRKKKKKNKPWRFVKRAFLLTIGALF